MSIYAFGPFRLDAARLLLEHDGQPLSLGPKVVETLLALVEHPGEVLSKAELLDRIWPEGFVEEANLAQNIYVIRKTLRAHWETDAIATVPRRGYRFVAPVAAEQAAPARPVEPSHRLRSSWARYAFGTAAVLVAALVVTLTAFSLGRSRAASGEAQPALSVQGARLYAMGRYYWNQRTRVGVERSLRYFDAVTRTDPQSALGYAALADGYAIMSDYHYGRLAPKEYDERAKLFAARALALDEHSAQAHAALGIVEDANHHRAQAQAEFRRAIALDPNYAPAHQWYGISLLLDGKSARAYSELQRASDLDPLAVATTDWLAQAAYFTRRYRDAIAYARQALDLSPQRIDSYVAMGLSYEALGKYPAALRDYRLFAAKCRCRAQSAALLAHVYAEMHRYAQAREELQIAQAGIGKPHGADPEDVVAALIAMGQRNDALRLLQVATKGHRAERALIALDPRLDPIRDDRRFRAWVRGPA